MCPAELVRCLRGVGVADAENLPVCRSGKVQLKGAVGVDVRGEVDDVVEVGVLLAGVAGRLRVDAELGGVGHGEVRSLRRRF